MALASAPRRPYRTKLDRSVIQIEETEAWKRIHRLAYRGHLHLVAEQAYETDQQLGHISSIAARRLRQLGGSDDAA